MYDTVECPYCGHENDMSDGCIDLPDDNKLDHECENCQNCKNCDKCENDICIKCKEGYYKTNNYECEICNSKAVYIVFDNQ